MVDNLKSLIVNHLKAKLDVSDITPEVIVEALIDDLPDVVLLLAEENYLRGYAQGLADIRYNEKRSDSRE